MFITLHLAVVSGDDGIWFVAAEPSADLLSLQLSEYVRARVPYTLWPADARCVERALALGQAAAVETYFAKVGQRWDREYLFRTSVRVPAAWLPESPPAAAPTHT